MRIKRAGIITKLVAAAIAIYSIVCIFSLRQRTTDAVQLRDELLTQVEELTGENEKLSYDLAHADDPETIESIAREKLGLVKPGEKIFYTDTD